MHDAVAPLDSYLVKYDRHLQLCRDWLLRSMTSAGGSRAHFSPLGGWSRAYPETTGYIITTLLEVDRRVGDPAAAAAARQMGRWLLSIQEQQGFWRSGLYPYAKDASPSVFNTGQILGGLVALSTVDGNAGYLEGARRAADWLARGVDEDGLWSHGHYRDHQPDYYTIVTAPMLAYAAQGGGKDPVRAAAARAVKHILANRRPNGAFPFWGFDPDRPAFTHTIAYTLQGLIEGADLPGGGGEDSLAAARPALERLRRQAELRNGRLPGAFDRAWRPDRSFECLTGSAQVAICLLLLHRREPDLRLVNAAAKLVERLCALHSTGPLPGLNGALAGSKPLWGPYMRLRYPNWAAKFFADALMLLGEALRADATAR